MKINITPQVIQLIELKIEPLIRTGCRVDQIKMVCAAGTELVKEGLVETGFGKLRVESSNFVPQGKSYLIDDRYRGFTWVRSQKTRRRRVKSHE